MAILLKKTFQVDILAPGFLTSTKLARSSTLKMVKQEKIEKVNLRSFFNRVMNFAIDQNFVEIRDNML